MKVGFVLVVFSSVAFAQNCPELPPTQCGPNEMTCGGGIDAAGCPLPNTCLANEDATAICPVSCPVLCPPDHSTCSGGTDSNGCSMPDTCMPPTFGVDGSACPAMCPVPCSE